MEKKNVILLTPITGNGGIASWSRKYLKQFKSEWFNLIPVNRAAPQSAAFHNSKFERIVVGIRELFVVLALLRKTTSSSEVAVIHATTSGSLGTIRDFLVTFRRYKARSKTILQARYGCIPEDINRVFYGRFLLWTMSRYDELWVLDSRTEKCLKSYKRLNSKVYLVPNCINVNPSLNIGSKQYRHYAFIANLIPEKGLFELVSAFLMRTDDAILSIVGKGNSEVEHQLKEMIKTKDNENIFLMGQMTNEKAVEFMNGVDAVILPTYMPQEAFPISILEAMSLGKLVITTKRAALADMLTLGDGTPCGIFVGERSVEDISEAIDYCRKHPAEADELCKKAYKKVCGAYSTKTVYRLYENHYARLAGISLQ